MSYERTALTTAQLEDLDLEALGRHVRQRLGGGDEQREAGAARMGLLAKTGTRYAPTPVGMLLFGRLPQLMHPEWGLSAVRFSGTSVADPLAARANLEGALGALLAGALAFIDEHTADVSSENEYPREALREALVNALVHRDLRKPGRVALRIFDDRLELWNPGGIGELTVDLDDMLLCGGISAPRNPILAATARSLGMGEQIGRGLPCMRRSLAEGPSVRLEVRVSPRDFLVTFPSAFAPANTEPS